MPSNVITNLTYMEDSIKALRVTKIHVSSVMSIYIKFNLGKSSIVSQTLQVQTVFVNI